MNFTRRGLFKTIAGAFVASKAAPLLPAPAPSPPVFDALNAVTFVELNGGSYARGGSYTTGEVMFLSQQGLWAFKGLGHTTYDGGEKITQSLIYEFSPPDPNKCAVIKNLG